MCFAPTMRQTIGTSERGIWPGCGTKGDKYFCHTLI